MATVRRLSTASVAAGDCNGAFEETENLTPDLAESKAVADPNADANDYAQVEELSREPEPDHSQNILTVRENHENDYVKNNGEGPGGFHASECSDKTADANDEHGVATSRVSGANRQAIV